MQKLVLLLITTTLSLNIYSQINFEPGYFIDNAGQKIDCLIKNTGWKNNPTGFEYKLSINAVSKNGDINSVQGFGINNILKYTRSTVKIDRSNDNINRLSTDENPIFIKETLFLKILVQGSASLYQYTDGVVVRYFYNIDTSEIEQLIYRSYKTADNKIGKDNTFKHQLWHNLKCSDFNIQMIELLEYKKNDLVKFFIKYNECNGAEFINYEEKVKKDLFNLTPRIGANISSLSIQNRVSNSRDTDFGSEFALRFGLEAEFVIPFHKNKWSLIIEPTYQYFKSGTELPTQAVSVDYKSIELPVGIRHYFFLNDNAKIFLNGSFIAILSNNGSIIDFESERDLEIRTENNFAFGLGYKYNDKYSLELRYQTPREVLDSFVFWSSNYQTLSMVFGYSFF